MEAEERPTKLQKLEHGTGNNPEREPDHAQLPTADTLNSENTAEGNHVASLVDDSKSSSSLPAAASAEPTTTTATTTDPTPPLSKSAQKRLKRHLRWESQRAERKAHRKEKRRAKASARREALASGTLRLPSPSSQPHHTAVQLPIAIVLDCGFDSLMNEREKKSLASQITRSYSDNKGARLRAHLAVAEFGGGLKERFDTALHGHHNSWKGIVFDERGLQGLCERMQERVKGDEGGVRAGAFAPARKPQRADGEEEEAQEGQAPPVAPPDDKDDKDGDAEDAEARAHGEVVYLSSDSPHTLTTLRPYSTYVVGGLVDKNRHKGACHAKAARLGMRTARLPIGDYLRMASRQVLATNHVVEIMLRWLETGDWAEAFVRVIPKRKGAELREEGERKGEGEEVVEMCEVGADGEESGEGEGSESSGGEDGVDERLEGAERTAAAEDVHGV